MEKILLRKYNALNVSLVLPVQHVATKIRSYTLCQLKYILILLTNCCINWSSNKFSDIQKIVGHLNSLEYQFQGRNVYA